MKFMLKFHLYNAVQKQRTVVILNRKILTLVKINNKITAKNNINKKNKNKKRHV